MIHNINEVDPYGVLRQTALDKPNTTRQLPMPYDHLSIDGPTIGPRTVSKDIISTASHLLGLSPQGVRDIEADVNGALIVNASGGVTYNNVGGIHNVPGDSAYHQVSSTFTSPEQIYVVSDSWTLTSSSGFNDAIFVALGDSLQDMIFTAKYHIALGIWDGKEYNFTTDSILNLNPPMQLPSLIGYTPPFSFWAKNRTGVQAVLGLSAFIA